MSHEPIQRDEITIQWGRFRATIHGRPAIFAIAAVAVVAAVVVSGRLLGLI
jgi:hypothetical protein